MQPRRRPGEAGAGARCGSGRVRARAMRQGAVERSAEGREWNREGEGDMGGAGGIRDGMGWGPVVGERGLGRVA